MGDRSGLISIHVLLKDAEFASELTLRATAAHFRESYRKVLCDPPHVRRQHTPMLPHSMVGTDPHFSGLNHSKQQVRAGCPSPKGSRSLSA
jgi:hypothetical protein